MKMTVSPTEKGKRIRFDRDDHVNVAAAVAELQEQLAKKDPAFKPVHDLRQSKTK